LILNGIAGSGACTVRTESGSLPVFYLELLSRTKRHKHTQTQPCNAHGVLQHSLRGNSRSSRSLFSIEHVRGAYRPADPICQESRLQKHTCRKAVTRQPIKRLLTRVIDLCRCQLVMAHGPATKMFANSQSPKSPRLTAMGSTPVCLE
jgi:hypothetical protein